MVWAGTSAGKYTVSSAYRMLTNHVDPIAENKKWLKLWKLPCPYKIKMFLWKCMKGANAMNDILHSRIGVPMEMCVLCKETQESNDHLFLKCPFIRAIWFGCCGGHIPEEVAQSSCDWVFDVLMRKEVTEGERGMEMCAAWANICWAVWLTRNKEDTRKIMALIKKDKVSSREEINIRWNRPPVNWLKLNVDGAARGAPGDAAIGAIIRDEDGYTVGALAQKIGTDNAVHTEAQALVEGIKLALALNYKRLLIESDSQSIVTCFLKQKDVPWRLEILLEEARHMCQFFLAVKISKIFREANHAADKLANHALNSFSCFWFKNPPQPVAGAISDDFYGRSFTRIITVEDE